MRLALRSLLVVVALLPVARAQAIPDGRAGTVLDVQGAALVSPAGHDRWAPLAARDVVMPGDRVRTMARGANAVEITLAGGGRIVLGPGGLAEITGGDDGARLLSGEMELTPADRPPAFLRVRDGKLDVLTAPPRWLTGYRSSTTNEWMGSLVAQVDGRDVALTIGYHKVEVVVRDQIAETTIEESFVNGTDATLEGAFTFPLPADASISGFGMWIGDELVMADIVERGRAREIYEDIRKRRKDPGLLEWSGGNLFKARVFPIFPHSEKRVKIRYTQVLPLTGTRLRYTYALRSEMLRAHPLRTLSIGVSVQSALPIAAAACPSHAAAVKRTDHEVRIDYDAAEVTPDRDFEVTVDLAAVSPLTVLPHRRGPDGYFLLLLSPPDPAAAGLARRLPPEGAPLDLILLADTSGSMDGAARAAQAAFLEALLGLLGPKDTFRLATVDREVRFCPAASDAEAALAFLAARDSLGFTDLDAALAAAAAQATPATHVVYLGDGIGTARDPDPADLARRIGLLSGTAKGTFHAVATGSSYEATVLAALAALGGGSVRDGAADPAGAAYALLTEVARPPVKDLAVSFEGVRTARVYPERLPNLPAGTQQAVLGRFLPGDGDTRGTVVVTGTLDGKPVRYEAPFALAAGETGNDFLPRLWARRHVDALLKEALTPEVKEEIVAFSAEFAIMTPLTSFLVLENDEDRETYGVTRRVAMRDGERFFAQARDKVATEMVREVVRQAGAFRKSLRARALAEIADLGRSLVPGAVALADMEIDGRYMARTAATAGEAVFGAVEQEAGADIGGVAFEGGEEADHNESDSDSPAEMPLEESLEVASKMLSDHKYVDAEDRPRAAYFGRPARGVRAVEGRETLRGLVMTPPSPAPPPALDLFPVLPPPPAPEKPPTPIDAPEDVRALIASLDRTAVVDAFAGGLAVRYVSGRPHPLRGGWMSTLRAETLFAAGDWLTSVRNSAGYSSVALCRSDTRSLVSPATLLGRRRLAAPADRTLSAANTGLPLFDFARTWEGCRVALEARDGDLATLRIRRPSGTAEEVFVLDTVRRVPTEARFFERGKLTHSIRWSEWTEVAGLPVPGLVEHLDAEGQVVSRTETQAAARPAAEVAEEIARRAAAMDAVLLLPAATKDSEDPDSFAGRFAAVLGHAARGRHDETLAAWAKAKEAAAGKPGADVVEAALLAAARRGEALLALLTRLAGESGAKPEADRAGYARALLSIAYDVLGENETLALVTILRATLPSAGEDDVAVAREFDERRAALLAELGRTEEARAVRERLVAEDPDDAAALYHLMTVLPADEALAAAARGLGRAAKWLPEEQDLVRERQVDVLWGERRFAEFLAAVEAWIAASPAREDAYQRRLVGLLYSGRIEDVDREVLAALSAGPGDPVTPAGTARFAAAAGFALGQSWCYWTNRIEEGYLAPLGAAALTLARREDDAGGQAGRIFGHWRFRDHDEYRRVYTALRADLLTPETLRAMSVARLVRTAQWIDTGREAAGDAEFAVLAAEVERRFDAAGPADRDSLGGLLLRLLDRRGDAKAAIAFLRRRLASEPETTAPEVAGTLFSRLLNGEWSEATEDEALALLPRLVPPAAAADDDPGAASRAFAGLARSAAEGLIAGRVEATLPPPAERETLPRADLKARTKEARKAARIALAVRFAEEAAKATPALAPWLALEGLSFAVEAFEDPAALEGRAREMLLSPPALPAPDLTETFEERASLLLDYLATRRGAPAGLADRVLALAREREKAAEGDAAKTRRYRVFRLLLALDRPDDLLAALRGWAAGGPPEAFYRLALGYLLAERSAFAEAAAEFEALARADALPPDGCAALATFCLALGEDQRRERALDLRLALTPEWELERMLSREISRTRSLTDGVPGELDPEVFRIERVLLGKASQPAEHVYLVGELYSGTKDFRALAALADGVPGHSPEAVYPYLSQVWALVSEVHEEATLDELATRVAERAAAAATDTDRRGLLYLRALVRRRAAEVANRPEGHAADALAALTAAFPGSWRPGEARHLAEFLGGLSAIPDAALAAEQVRQLTALRDLVPADTEEGLAVAAALAGTLSEYERTDEALDVLSAALDAVRAAHGGVLPGFAFEAADTFVTWLQGSGRYAHAEEWLLAERERQRTAGGKAWFTLRLLGVYAGALETGGRVSLGEGEALFAAAFARAEAAIADLPAGEAPAAVHALCRIVRGAARLPGGKAADHLTAFARERLRPLLSRMPDSEQNLWFEVARAVHDTGRPDAAIALLVTKLEGDPAWYRRLDRDGWDMFANALAEWRAERNTGGELAERLAKIVVGRLEGELVSGENRAWVFCHRESARFWAERAEEFATAARRVIEMRADSPSTVLRAAEYLWDGLALKPEAVAALAALDGRGKLPDDGRLRLARWLVLLERNADAIPHLTALLTKAPDRIEVRCLLAACRQATGADDAGKALVDEGEALAKAHGAWGPDTMGALAQTCFDCGWHDRAARWFEEEIRFRERGPRPDRERLAYCYGRYARSLVALGRTGEAVDAAAAAVVAWGETQDGRQEALADLEKTIAALPDLDAWVASLDAKAAESGLDAPVLRKAAGAVYLSRSEFDKATAQYEIARTLSPTDREVHDALVACRDGAKDPAGAVAALREGLRCSPADLNLMMALAERLEKAGAPEEAERARTNYVEAEPLEAEGHVLLAMEREKAQRFEEAIAERRIAVRLREFDPEPWFALVQTLRAAGRADEAKSVLLEMLDRKWSAEAGDVRARVQEEMK